MKTSFKLEQSLKQTLHLSRGMQKQINMLSMNRLELSSLLSDIASTNPFLEYTTSADVSKIMEETISTKPSLQDELYYQLHTSRSNYSDQICSYIIESLNDHGFFYQDIKEACKYLNVEEMIFQENLKFIQSFEPIGVAAKSSVDSICIQLRYKGYKKAAIMLESYGKEIEENQLDVIAKKMKVSIDTIYEYLQCVRTCNPFPCSNYSSNPTELILPELEIKIEEDDILLEPKSIGQISFDEKANKKEMNAQIREYFDQAKFYVDSLNKRNKTLLILSNELFKIQSGYFLYNDQLRSCTLKDIAANTGFSLSTVSRTFFKKYYLYNGALYPFKDLFVSSTKKGSSKDAIQNAILYFVENEDKTHPYMDEELVNLLKDMELFVSRRTVSKYRDQLNIPNSKKRKKQGKSRMEVYEKSF